MHRGLLEQRLKMPDNSGYMIAAYVVAGALYFGYAAFLIMRGRSLRDMPDRDRGS